MTKILNKETGKYETITKPEDLPAVSWAETVACGGDKESLDRLWEKGSTNKEIILKELKKEAEKQLKNITL